MPETAILTSDTELRDQLTTRLTMCEVNYSTLPLLSELWRQVAAASANIEPTKLRPCSNPRPQSIAVLRGAPNSLQVLLTCSSTLMQRLRS